MRNHDTNTSKNPSYTTTLTDSYVQKLQPKEKPYDVRDDKIKGLHVRVETSGTKTYRCEYKRKKYYTFGRVENFKLAQIRGRAKEIIGDAEKGIDINEQKKLDKLKALEESNKFTFDKFLEEKYKPWYKATHPKTWQNTFQVLDTNFKKSFGKLLLEEITVEKVEKWRSEAKGKTILRYDDEQKEKIQQPVTPSTINRYIERLSAVLGKAVDYGYLDKNPILKIQKLKVDVKNRIRFLSEEEYQALLSALDEREKEIKLARAKGNQWRNIRGYELKPNLDQQVFADHLKPMVLLALGSGIRFNSLCSLRWEKNIEGINSENIALNLTPDILKNQVRNLVPLSKKTAKILRLWYQQTYDQHQGTGWVFPGKNPGQHITTVRKSWNTLLKKANIKNFHWHDQRHDFASNLAMSGVDAFTIKELLGHSDVRMSEKYIHMAAQHKVNAVEKLEERRNKFAKKNKS